MTKDSFVLYKAVVVEHAPPSDFVLSSTRLGPHVSMYVPYNVKLPVYVHMFLERVVSLYVKFAIAK